LIAPTTACSARLEYLGQERPLHFAVDITECSDGGGVCTTPECDQLLCHSHAVLGMNVAVFDTWLGFIESGTLPSTSDDVVLEPATCMRDATWPAWSASTTEAIFCASGGCDPCLPF
jgi:hypothetical protein